MNIGTMLTTATTGLRKTAIRGGLVVRKKSPEILFGLGVLSFGGAMVASYKAALTADEIMKHHKRKMKDIRDAQKVAKEHPDQYEYDNDLVKRDKTIQTFKTIVDLGKAYAPVIALGGLSLASFLASRNILNSRYLGAVSAYNAVSEAFSAYRSRVKNELGEDQDRHFRYGANKLEMTTVDENGKKSKEQQELIDTKQVSPDDSCVVFDQTSRYWDPNPKFSMMFLRNMQNRLTDKLHEKGHVFLNEVYDALDLPHTQEGALLGWVEGMGDDYVDFGLYDTSKENVRRFINGHDNVVLLEFNHDGPIWDKI